MKGRLPPGQDPDGPPNVASRPGRGKRTDPRAQLSAPGRGSIRGGMADLPLDPDPRLLPFEPVAERTVSLLGSEATLMLVPGRKSRTGRVHADRPALLPDRAGRILREETLWRGDGLALTPNRFPFAREQRILWMAQPAREPDQRFWQAALQWVDAVDGTVLLNNIGAAATIPRAHAHLIGERSPFLGGLAECALTDAPDLIDLPDRCELLAKQVPFCLVGVRGGDPAARALALVRLADVRMTATWNVIATRGEVWVAPRSVETPTPHFEQALGASEVWGRWCYVDEPCFERATSQDLERALRLATMPPLSSP